jgi:DNA-binding winged helix-turn-helix (wHTH) protein
MHDNRRTVVFGPFTADLRTGELWREGRRIPLQQQPFRLLKALVERPGELVTRDELRRTLWPDGTFVSFERGLISAIRKVREALGDRADCPAYIETLQGRGYRFIASVGPSDGDTRLPPAIVSRPTPAYRQRLALALAVALAVFVDGQSVDRRDAAARLAAAESLSAYACALKTEGRFDEALAVIERAQALAPSSARITAEVGFYLHAARRFEAEFPMLQKAIALDARSPDAWLHLGLAYARREQFGRAIEALEHAQALAAGDSRIRGWLAWARAQDHG